MGAVVTPIAVVTIGLAIGVILLRVVGFVVELRRERAVNRQIARRLDVIRRSSDPDSPPTESDDPRDDRGRTDADPRRLLWRDASAALILFSVGLVAILSLSGGSGSAGGILGATATAPLDTPADTGIPDETTSRPDVAGPAIPSASDAVPLAASSSPDLSPRTSAPSGDGPSPERLAALTACPGRQDCYIYVVRQGDNLTSIANWFGVPYATILSLNPADP